MKKTLKTLGAMSLLAFLSAASVHAATYTVYLTGSTAFRGAAYNGIINYLKSINGNVAPVGAYNGSSLGGASAAVIESTVASNVGNLLAGDTVIYKTFFNGSASGVNALANATPPSFAFIDQTDAMHVTLSAVTAGTDSGSGVETRRSNATGGTAVTAGFAVDSHAANAALADVLQKDTFATGGTFATLAAPTRVGIVPFRWISNNGSPLTNIGHENVGTLFKNGAQTQGLLDDDVSLTAPVVIVGRDFDSGTRATALIEGNLPGSTTSIIQYLPNVSSGQITSFTAEADSGDNSGGTLAGRFIVPSASSAVGYAVGYLSESDAATALNDLSHPAVPLKFDGHTYSRTNLANGAYGFWSVENFYVASSLSGGLSDTTSGLATQIENEDALTSGLRLPDVDNNVLYTRDDAGAVINVF